MPVKKLLKDARRAAGMTQTDLAERSGVSQTYISDLEASAAPNPTIDVVRRLEKALRCDLRFPRPRSTADSGRLGTAIDDHVQEKGVSHE